MPPSQAPFLCEFSQGACQRPFWSDMMVTTPVGGQVTEWNSFREYSAYASHKLADICIWIWLKDIGTLLWLRHLHV